MKQPTADELFSSSPQRKQRRAKKRERKGNKALTPREYSAAVGFMEAAQTRGK